MKVVRRYLPAGLINPSLLLSPILRRNLYTTHPPPPHIIIERGDPSPPSPFPLPRPLDPSTSRGSQFSALSQFHWTLFIGGAWIIRLNDGRAFRSVDAHDSDIRWIGAIPGWLVITEISSACMTSRQSFILVITRYASALDNEICAAVKQGAPDPSCISRSTSGGSITKRVSDCEYDRRSTAKRGKRTTDKTNELKSRSVKSQIITNERRFGTCYDSRCTIDASLHTGNSNVM